MKKAIGIICLICVVSFIGCSSPKNNKVKIEHSKIKDTKVKESKIEKSKEKEHIKKFKSSLKIENIKEISIAKMPSPPQEKIIDKKKDINKIVEFLKSINTGEEIQESFKGWVYLIKINNNNKKESISFFRDKIEYKNKFYKVDEKSIKELEKLYKELKYIETDLINGDLSEKGSYLGSENDTNVDLSSFTLNKGEDEYSAIKLVSSPLDKNNLTVNFKRFQGVYTMGLFELNKGKKLFLDYKGKIEDGKINIIVEDENYNILKIVEANKEEIIEIQANKDGKYIIRLVGDMASNGQIKLTVKPKVP